MATRKRARTDDGQFKADDPVTPQNEAFEPPTFPITVDTLAAFIGDEQPDPDLLQQALALATAAAETVTGNPVGDAAPHAICHGIHLLAAHLLITNELDAQPTQSAIPLVVRALWRQPDARHQPV